MFPGPHEPLTLIGTMSGIGFGLAFVTMFLGVFEMSVATMPTEFKPTNHNPIYFWISVGLLVAWFISFMFIDAYKKVTNGM